MHGMNNFKITLNPKCWSTLPVVTSYMKGE